MYNKSFFSVPKKAETRSEFGADCPKKQKQHEQQSFLNEKLRVIFAVTKLPHTAYA